jgi:TPR repeat protein
MLSQRPRPIMTTATLCLFAFLLVVAPLQSQSDSKSLDIASLRQKAEAGDTEAQAELGQRYFIGRGVAEDPGQARAWCQRAADKGNARGEVLLGQIYQFGAGVTVDFAQARTWYQKAADQGDPEGQTRLGLLYEQGGKGVNQDYVQARLWYQKAAGRGSRVAQTRLAAMNAVNSPAAASCDPNWSPKFSQITSGGFDNSPASVRQITEQQIAKYGGVSQSIRQVESEKASYQQQLVQQQNDGNAAGIEQVQQLLLFSDGMLDILRCRQQIATQASSTSPGATTAASNGASGTVPPGNLGRTTNPQVAAQIDVRYLQVDSRPLTSAEMQNLRDSLRWDPDSVPLTPGGVGQSNLVDDRGRRLGSVLVRWGKTVTSKGTQSQAPGQMPGHFTIQVENGTSCVFQSSAELDDSQGFMVVSDVTWSGWLTLHQPERGQKSQVKGDAALPQAYPSLVLKPLTAYSTLSACMTPKTP